MTILQQHLQATAIKTAASFILRNASREDRRMCLAYKYNRASKRCRKFFDGTSRFHQFCCGSCYQKLHRLPGFVRRIIKEAD